MAAVPAGKRESRRYIGAHVLTQGDIEAGGPFDDVVAYGGWTMDDHHPAGFWSVKTGAPATIFHPAPSPYGIPLRCLTSRTVRNLMFAGRDASATHAAMSSTRVMGTASSMGQAVGIAAAIAVRRDLMPADLGPHVRELQHALLRDDAYVPGVRQAMPKLTAASCLEASQGDPEPVRDGISRPVGDEPHAWACCAGDWLEYRFRRPANVSRVTLVLDSALDRIIQMSWHQKDDQLTSPPDVMAKTFRIEGKGERAWQTVARVEGNHQRLVRVPIDRRLDAIRFVLEATWGAGASRVFAFAVE